MVEAKLGLELRDLQFRFGRKPPPTRRRERQLLQLGVGRRCLGVGIELHARAQHQILHGVLIVGGIQSGYVGVDGDAHVGPHEISRHACIGTTQVKSGDVHRLQHRVQGIRGVVEFGVHVNRRHRVGGIDAVEESLARQGGAPGLARGQVKEDVVGVLAQGGDLLHLHAVKRQHLVEHGQVSARAGFNSHGFPAAETVLDLQPRGRVQVAQVEAPDMRKIEHHPQSVELGVEDANREALFRLGARRRRGRGVLGIECGQEADALLGFLHATKAPVRVRPYLQVVHEKAGAVDELVELDLDLQVGHVHHHGALGVEELHAIDGKLGGTFGQNVDQETRRPANGSKLQPAAHLGQDLAHEGAHALALQKKHRARHGQADQTQQAGQYDAAQLEDSSSDRGRHVPYQTNPKSQL